ncbi:SpoIIIAH-like family protein [Massiliimalia massiliensis]|uniref:SpoIIIAH-like family protein n=1 Tax=Massiliimalia massiliensis TaxID=1852384 RepID=UPI0013563D08|nr:SpoIIIAH-like family protein [Massiliimalia massiliensis]
MKANFVIGKKQIILAALVVLLGGAVYVNYLYADKGDDYLVTDVLNQTSQTESAAETGGEVTSAATDGERLEGKNYGDAQLVGGEVTASEYFEKAQLERTKARDEAVETVKSVLENSDASAEEVAEATSQIVEISQQIEDESKIENLIKAKGFAECVVYLDGETANVVVQTSGLKVEEAAQIKNIVLSQKDIKAENITIQEVNQ